MELAALMDRAQPGPRRCPDRLRYKAEVGYRHPYLGCKMEIPGQL